MSSSEPAPGALLGNKYRVLAIIGAGAMGRVFQAQNEFTGKLVALKWMHADVAAAPNAAERLLREARAASKLKHPNVVDIYDIVHEGSTLFLVMELLEGETLSAYLRRNQQLALSEFIALLLQALEGVAAAHDKGVIHRDLKPDNIFLVRAAGSEKVTVKVVDFGVAKLTGQPATKITQTGSAVGTPLYMSFEQLRADRSIDGRSDIYAFGVMLYEAITGQMPYSASSITELAIKVATSEPVAVTQLRADVPTSLADIVERACARDRERRTPTARALLAELEPFASEPGFRAAMMNPAAPMPLVAASDHAQHAYAARTMATLPAGYVPTVPAHAHNGPSTFSARETAARDRPLRRYNSRWRIATVIGLGLALLAIAVSMARRAHSGSAARRLAPLVTERAAATSVEPVTSVTEAEAVAVPHDTPRSAPSSIATPGVTSLAASSSPEPAARSEPRTAGERQPSKRRASAAVERQRFDASSHPASRGRVHLDPFEELGF
jgi:serine/threonine-protein kinase